MMTRQRNPSAGWRPRQPVGKLLTLAWVPTCAGMPPRLMGLVVILTFASLASIAVAQTAEVVFDLSIAKGRVAANMRLIRVRQGDAVKLRWTTDRPISLHLHGYDIETRIEPGTVAEMRFTARVTGRFPIEEHRSNAKGGHSHGEAPLVHIEVYPR
jgi:hypothetical protein